MHNKSIRKEICVRIKDVLDHIRPGREEDVVYKVLGIRKRTGRQQISCRI